MFSKKLKKDFLAGAKHVKNVPVQNYKEILLNNKPTACILLFRVYRAWWPHTFPYFNLGAGFPLISIQDPKGLVMDWGVPMPFVSLIFIHIARTRHYIKAKNYTSHRCTDRDSGANLNCVQ